MEKKTALDLAIVDAVNGYACPKDYFNPVKCEIEFKDCPYETKIECFKKWYKQNANIPDGWDVVKEIYHSLNKERKEVTQEGLQEKNAEALGIGGGLAIACNVIKDELQQAGIEVEDV